MSRMHRKIEILAPAGNFESFMTAVNAGADAVYAGGPRFGARAYADNFTVQELTEAIDYAHLHQKKFYLTVNTLLKNSEISGLYKYLEPLYCQGLDAVIVQDIGVLSFVRTYFPEMEIHASTQMTITNVKGAQFLKDAGVKRVVPARELALSEIQDIQRQTGMDVECFVHGALCYCYSGQCLLSSFIGGRSGNRGQCAQPCRLPYSVGKKKGYLLSLKDICTLDMIPALAEAGIHSFKIEGRMKRPEYVAAVTAMYRKYLDKYMAEEKENFSVEPEDIERLKDIYNRGGFHAGYYKKHNGKDMLSLDRPNHAGVPAVRVLSQTKREVKADALVDIHKGDILELTEKRENYTFGKDVKKGEKVTFLAPKQQFYKKGKILNRIRNKTLLDEMDKAYVFARKQEKVDGSLHILKGRQAVLCLTNGMHSVEVYTEECVSEAQTRPLTKEEVKAQLTKTGNTQFYFENLEIEMEENIFLPMQQIKQMRRDALAALEKEICRSYRRAAAADEKNVRDAFEVLQVRSGKDRADTLPFVSVSVETEEQLYAVLAFCEKMQQQKVKVSRLYLDFQISGTLFLSKNICTVCERIRKCGVEIYYAMPHIFREQALRAMTKSYETFYMFCMDGVLVRNYEEIQFLREQKFDKPIILDHNLYIFNQYGKRFFEEQKFTSFTAPMELNVKELEELGIENAELTVYGHIPVMISAQCITKTMDGCTKEPGMLMLTDRYKNLFPVKNYCSLCYNVIYNTAPLYLADLTEEIRTLCPKSLRFAFTVETKERTLEILEKAGQDLTGETKNTASHFSYTRGHFRRGIL